MNDFTLKAVLCDIGGVLYAGDHLIKGAVEAVAKIKSHYPIRFLTNTTQKTGKEVYLKLKELGFLVNKEEIITALDVTKHMLEDEKSNAYFLLKDDVIDCFSSLSDYPLRYVVVGDAQDNFNYLKLNRAFRYLQEGKQLLAIAKNKYFRDNDGKLSLDAGCFVAGLEYACECEAILIGKPNKTFYHAACHSMGVDASDAIMIGDDIYGDILGAQNAGLKTIFVKTGKFTSEDLKKGISPTLILDSIADFDATILS